MNQNQQNYYGGYNGESFEAMTARELIDLRKRYDALERDQKLLLEHFGLKFTDVPAKRIVDAAV